MQINDSLPGKHNSPPFLLPNPLTQFRTLEGYFELHGAPQGPSTWPPVFASGVREKQGAAMRAEEGSQHCQEQLTQTLIVLVRLLKAHFFTPILD